MRRFDHPQAFAETHSRFTSDDPERAARIAWQNRPAAVFREMALVIGGTAAFVLAVNVVLAVLHLG